MNHPRTLRRPDVPQWLEEIAMIPNGSFPMDAMQDLWRRGGEVEGVLLDYVRWLADDAEMGWLECDEDGWLHFIAFFLLTDRGCRDAFEPLVKIASDDEYADFVMGEAVIEDLPFWLAAVGTPAQLKELIENQDVNPWLPVAALAALGAMAWDGRLPRQEHHDYLEELAGRHARRQHPVWLEWLSQVGLFAWEDLLPAVAELEKAGLFDGWEGVESTRKLMAEPDREVWAVHALVRYRSGGMAGLEQFSKFICFQPGYEEEDDEDGEEEPTPWNASFVSKDPETEISTDTTAEGTPEEPTK